MSSAFKHLYCQRKPPKYFGTFSLFSTISKSSHRDYFGLQRMKNKYRTIEESRTLINTKLCTTRWNSAKAPTFSPQGSLHDFRGQRVCAPPGGEQNLQANWKEYEFDQNNQDM